MNSSTGGFSSAGGSVTIIGYGSTSDTTGGDYGIYVAGPISNTGSGTIPSPPPAVAPPLRLTITVSICLNGGTINTVNGAITVTGIAGNGSGGSNYGADNR